MIIDQFTIIYDKIFYIKLFLTKIYFINYHKFLNNIVVFIFHQKYSLVITVDKFTIYSYIWDNLIIIF